MPFCSLICGLLCRFLKRPRGKLAVDPSHVRQFTVKALAAKAANEQARQLKRDHTAIIDPLFKPFSQLAARANKRTEELVESYNEQSTYAISAAMTQQLASIAKSVERSRNIQSPIVWDLWEAYTCLTAGLSSLFGRREDAESISERSAVTPLIQSGNGPTKNQKARQRAPGVVGKERFPGAPHKDGGRSELHTLAMSSAAPTDNERNTPLYPDLCRLTRCNGWLVRPPAGRPTWGKPRRAPSPWISSHLWVQRLEERRQGKIWGPA